MLFTKTPIEGAFVIDIEKREDERGFFARVMCQKEMSAEGMNVSFVQTNTSYNYKAGTIRGLHYQKAPHGENKYMRCVQGKLFQVIVDIRKDSKSYGQWFGAELSLENQKGLYIPAGCATGYQALADNTIALYSSTAFYESTAEAGVRYNDPRFAITWPVTTNITISDKDKVLPDFTE